MTAWLPHIYIYTKHDNIDLQSSYSKRKLSHWFDDPKQKETDHQISFCKFASKLNSKAMVFNNSCHFFMEDLKD